MKRAVTIAMVLALMAMPGIPYAQSPGPINYYSFDRCNARDSGPMGNDGVIHGHPFCSKGIKGKALCFNGIDDYIELARTIQKDFTISLWIKTSSPSLKGNQCYQGNGVLWSDVAGPANDFILAVLNDRACFFTGNPDMSLLGKTPIVDGSWHHLVVVRKMALGRVTLYVDGKREGTMFSSRNPLDAQRIMVLGANILDKRFFEGCLDEVKIYDRALSEQEVSLLSGGKASPPEKTPESSPFGQAREAAFRLKGTIYAIPPNTGKLPDFSRLKPIGTIYAQELNIPPTKFDRGFPGVTNRFEWFAIDYKGSMFIPRGGTYTFALISDDGARLIIDGKTIIDNDGIHPPTRKEGSITLKPGLHTIEVQYFQGPRYYVALQLLVKRGNTFVPWNAQAFSPVQVKEEKGVKTLVLSNQVLFDFNSDQLKPQARLVLQEVAKVISQTLREHPHSTIVVEGHTDNIGSQAYNLDLSRRRALHVAQYLETQKVPRDRLTIRGLGESQPLFPNDTEEHRAKNRRVEIKIIYQE